MRLPLTLVCLGLMAGTTYAAPQYATYIELTESSDVAVLEASGDPGDNIFQIRSLNGTFAPKLFALPTNELVILMKGGDDTLTFDASVLDQRVDATILSLIHI